MQKRIKEHIGDGSEMYQNKMKGKNLETMAHHNNIQAHVMHYVVGGRYRDTGMARHVEVGAFIVLRT